MPEPLDAALDEVRDLILDPDRLVRAVAAGRRRGAVPSPVRAELRTVELKAGRRLQLVASDGRRPTTQNLDFGPAAESVVNDLLREPFGNWHVETTAATLQLRVTKRGEAQVHRSAPVAGASDTAGARRSGFGGGVARPLSTTHDRVKLHLLAPDDPLYAVIGGTAAKRRQVDAFLRALASTLDEPVPSPLRVVDLGCGNAYLTFAAFQYLSGQGHDVHITGIEVREDQRQRNTALAQELGCTDRVRFIAGTIAESAVDSSPDLVLALHACDTATDEALARAVRWGARWILAAPCCHHDLAAQLRGGSAPRPYEMMIRHGILRERFADTLTDTLRAALLRLHGYRVEVIEFVDSQHTPRNLLLRARHTGAVAGEDVLREYDEITGAWHVTPHLAKLLGRHAQPLTPASS